MANYTIIGGDQKEYGPISGEDVRQWVAEGRLDANTQARSENDTEWRQLSAFPEFAPLFQYRPPSPPPMYAPTSQPLGDAQSLVNAPAICLMVTASLNALLGLYNIIKSLFFPENVDEMLAKMPIQDPEAQKMMSSWMHMATGPLAIGANGLALVISVVILMGAIRMRALRNYEFAFTAAILAMIPCLTSCCLLGLPFGIWALIVLRKPGVKDQFN